MVMVSGLRRKVMNLILRIRRALERRGSPRNRCYCLVVTDAIPTCKHAMDISSSRIMRLDKFPYDDICIVSDILHNTRHRSAPG
jgi:hypothetical protein